MREVQSGRLTPGMRLCDRYWVVQLLGEGGFSQTYEIDDNGSRKVLKVLLEDYPKAVSLFQREARVLGRLHHPGIPHVEPDGYFTFTVPDRRKPSKTLHLHGLVMEYIPGVNLKQWLQTHPPISQDQALDWLEQLVLILYQLHQQNYFHRDIKPSNIMLKPDGQLVLVDFGGVREVTETYLARQQNDHTGTRLASWGYAPLEQMEGRSVPQSDFFALGRTFVCLLTGQSPTHFHHHDQTGMLLWRQNAPQISLALADLVDWLMAIFPGQRPQTAAEIRTAIATIRANPNTSLLPDSAINLVPDPSASKPANSPASSSQSLTETGLPVPTPADQLWPKPMSGSDASDGSDTMTQAPPEHSRKLSRVLPRLLPRFLRDRTHWLIPVAAGAVSGLLMVLRGAGWFYSLELAAFDQFVQRLPSAEGDAPIVLVEITREDIQALEGEYPISDRTLLQALQILNEAKPALIGIDIYRDQPRGEGQADLVSYLQQNDHIVPICAHPSVVDEEAVASLPNIPAEQVGFVDVPLDRDDRVRRQLIADYPPQPEVCGAFLSLSAMLGLRYLEQQGYEIAMPDEQNQSTWRIEKPDQSSLQFQSLAAYRGFYPRSEWISSQQILLNPWSTEALTDEFNPTVERVTLTDVLNRQSSATASATDFQAQIRDRIILIGVTDPTVKDDFQTAYGENVRGLQLHAMMTAQLVSAVEQGRPLLRFVGFWFDLGWIAGWSAAAGFCGLQVRSQSKLILIGGGLVVLMSGIGWGCLWIYGTVTPIVPTITGITMLLIGKALLVALNKHNTSH
ncbi:MAG: CHASE2 domain-containing protein [Thainema sp.]